MLTSLILCSIETNGPDRNPDRAGFEGSGRGRSSDTSLDYHGVSLFLKPATTSLADSQAAPMGPVLRARTHDDLNS
jgi:hypothetical protein